MLEISIECIGVDADVPDDTQIEAGVPAHVMLQVVGGTDLPFASQPGSNRPLRVPTTSVRFSLTKEAATQLGDLLKEQAGKLPESKQSSLQIASSLSEAEQVARALDLTK